MALPTRLVFLVVAALSCAISAAEPIVCRLNRGASATEIAREHGLVLRGVTTDGRYARYDAPSVAEALRGLRGDRGIVAAESERPFRTAQERYTFVQKGSTIPAVGGRTSLQVANSKLLDLINWDPELAASPGRAVRVAILDTGLADAAVGLWDKVDASRNFVESNRLALDQPTGRDTDGNGEPDEAVGHGTVVAGIVDQVSPNSRFVIARIADSDGYATPWSLVLGIQFALANRAEVINISLADRRRSLLVELAVREAELMGVTVVGALGNDARDDAYEPAGTPNVVAVSAVGIDGVKASFSNWNSDCDVAAPGLSVVSRYWTGEGIQWSGTSFSAAFVSGAIADCLRRRGPVAPYRIRQALAASGVNIDAQNPPYRNKLGRLLDIRALNARLGN
jgi:hypothetical protein